MSTPDGILLVLVLTVPVVGLLLAFVLGGRNAERVTLLAAAVGLVMAGLLAAALWRSDQMLIYILGGWAPPLGIALRADGLSATMLPPICSIRVRLPPMILGRSDSWRKSPWPLVMVIIAPAG